VAKKQKNMHLGGTAMPLIVPDVDWDSPSTLPDLRNHKRIALDRETKDDGMNRGRGPGWAFGRAWGHILGTSIAWHEGDKVRSAYLPVRHPDTQCFDPEQIKQWEIDHQKAGVRFVCQNSSYDIGFGYLEGVPVPPNIDDTMCMANVIDTERSDFDLDSLCKWWGIEGKDESILIEALAAYGWPTGPKERKKHLWRLPARYVGPYAEQDARATLQLADLMDPEIDRQDVRAAYQLEMDLLPLVHEMRRRGIRVDLDAAERARSKFRKMREVALKELSDKMGCTVGIDEVRQASWKERAFEDNKVKVERDRWGKPHFESKVMKLNPHWLPQLVSRVIAAEDAAEKFVGTYILNFAHYNGVNTRLHATVNQFRSEDGGTRTFRLSYSDPPVQQAPTRDPDFKVFRNIFLPEKDEWWFSADYSQQEMRLMVHFAERYGLTKAAEAAQRYRDDPETDFHDMVVDMTGLDRGDAKNCSFAKSYGAGKDKFALMIHKSVEEAVRVMAQYDSELPFIRELNDLCQGSAERKGYVLLLDRARIHFNTWEPRWIDWEEKKRGQAALMKMNNCRLEEATERTKQEGHPWFGKKLRRAETRKAMNAKIQGCAARQTKMAMRDCWRAGHVPLLQIHDELNFSHGEERQGREVREIMVEAFRLNVPMLVDAGVGRNWGDSDRLWEDRGDPSE
jgi:DNA polymerase I-like protein with 3'-5' exonuclease and polymerase domains